MKYLVSNSGVSFDPSLATTVFGIDRKALCGGLVVMSFLLCLSATLWSATLYGELNTLGPDDACWFISKYWYLCDTPFLLCGLGIILMLANGAFVLGGLYDNHVLFYSVMTFGVIAIFAYFWLTTTLERCVYEKVKRKWVEAKREAGGTGSMPLGKAKAVAAGKVEPEVEKSNAVDFKQ
ncbi:hypothetical protein HDU93_004873 [Gonapodya sp. JEL0774]|nr:hypothetical protein HDU93_004873 [Gonapodya sp. JEL0774]